MLYCGFVHLLLLSQPEFVPYCIVVGSEASGKPVAGEGIAYVKLSDYFEHWKGLVVGFAELIALSEAVDLELQGCAAHL